MDTSDKVKVAAIVLAVIAINVVLWKCGLPTRWEIVR